MADPDALIDTCCLLNLCAIDDLGVVLPQLPFIWHLASSVEREEISIRPTPTAGRTERRRIDLSNCVTAGLLRRCELASNQERDLYVRIAIEVDDGEAMPLAIAAVRGWMIATDDAAARKVAADLGVVTFATPQLVRIWSQRVASGPEAIAQAIKRIETFARYVPNANLPDADWWASNHR